MTVEPRWIVAQVVKPTLAQTLLKQEGFETYAPKIRVQKRSEPLWRGYLLVRIVVRWYPVRWTPGVIRVLMNGEQPARLPDHVVTELRRNERGGFVKLPKMPGAIEPGTRVRITTGMFAGRFAIYQGMSGAARERVLLEWLGGQSVPMVMPIGSVEMVT